MFSPFQQHLGTNYAPSIEEVEEIKRILEFSELSKEIHDIDIEITQLHKRLHLLQERRSRVG
ncbi:hypothetical protein BDQ17DRAFT_1524703 [Cyathus striatus]|nr:hypothetical protein BDQ17DRAFT_1524703 [Cyathus striatus]